MPEPGAGVKREDTGMAAGCTGHARGEGGLAPGCGVTGWVQTPPEPVRLGGEPWARCINEQEME